MPYQMGKGFERRKPLLSQPRYRSRLSPNSATYHYADARSRATLCDLRLGGPLRILGGARTQQKGFDPALVIDDTAPDGGRLCEQCSAVLAGTQRRWRPTRRRSQGRRRRVSGRSKAGGRKKKSFAMLGLLAVVGIAAVIALIIFLQDGRQDPPEAVLAAMPTPTSTPPPTNTPTTTIRSAPTPMATEVVSSFSLRGFTNGRWLEQQDGRLASSIKRLGWIEDGVNQKEAETIQDLLYIAVTSRSVASSVVTLNWVEDGVNDVEAEAISQLNNIEGADIASLVVSLHWLWNDVDQTEVKAIEYLSYIANEDSATVITLVSFGWVQDGISPIEANTIRWISNFASPEVAASVIGFSWVGDGITGLENQFIEYLSYIANDDPAIAEILTSMEWIHDGITDLENRLTQELSFLSDGHPIEAMRIVGMQFLEGITSPDLSAVDALSDLASFRPQAFDIVMSHPTIRDGITDDMVPIVATLDGVAQTNPELIEVLLNPSKVLLERRVITLSLSGDVILDIIRTAPGAARSLDLLEHSVRGAEEFMRVPFPTGHVVLLYENAVYGSNAGTNFGTHIAIRPEFDVDDGSPEASFSALNNAHEVAHYYWSGNADWVDEGAAEFMASAIHGMRTGQPIGVTNAPCGYARSIAALETLRVFRGDAEFRCNYSLGERLFVDLHRALGGDSFRQGFRELYGMSVIEDDADDIRGTSVGIDEVRMAFGTGEGTANAVIARWYDGTEPHDLSEFDPSTADPRLSSINGQIEEAYIITSMDGPAVSVFSAEDVNDWVYLTLEYAYSLARGAHEVPVEIVEYFEDGFEFSRRSGSIGAEAEYIGGTSWFAVGQSPPRRWAPGRYVVYVYSGDRKVAEVEYEVTP